jgi:hypothetical protein
MTKFSLLDHRYRSFSLRNKSNRHIPAVLAFISLLLANVHFVTAANIDTLVLGDPASEQSHALVAQHSAVIRGGLDEQARELLPLDSASFEGGRVSFVIKVDPQQQNYMTVKLWGSDKGADRGRLVLFAEGLQVGYRHEGDYDVLNQTDEEAEFPGRFLYQTLPLPPALTHGKTSVSLKIASLGAMWSYGTTFAQYQKNLTGPTRGIYRIYTHTDTQFTPDASEKQGSFKPIGVRPSPGEEVIARSRDIVNDRLKRLLETAPTRNPPTDIRGLQSEVLLLAEAYNTQWCAAYHNPKVIQQIIRDGDSYVQMQADGGRFVSRDWFGAGPLGEAIMDVHSAMNDALDVKIGDTTRRSAWANVLLDSINFWRTHRRDYTNQSMIVDRNIYTANRALQLIDPGRALHEAKALRYVYEAVGLEPWLGSDVPDNGGDTSVRDASSAGVNKPFGEHYFLVTRKGLTRELGYVGSYGETILHFTHDIALLTGDEKIRQQLAKLEAARMYFRYPGVDADGYQCMKLASEIDNRTAHYPLAGSAYTAPNIREEWWMDLPALLSDDTVAVGAIQQGLADNQYFNYIQGRLADPDTLGMMRNVDEYEKVKSLPVSAYRMPMTDGQPDFAWADEQDAVLAIKHGDQRLFINFYYRAERGVNGVARLQELTPTIDRIATVRTEFKVPASGHQYTRPDWIDAIRSRGMPPPGEQIHQAWAGDILPIAPRPADTKLPAYGDWGPFLGKAAFYSLRYGDYLIGLNTNEQETYVLPAPAGFKSASDLISGKEIELSGDVKVPPLSTVVLYLGP